jgi:hypothetical protein
MADVLALFADCVNAYRSADPEAIEKANAEWKANVPRHKWHPDDDFEPDEDDGYRELSPGEYDRIADNYERNWV